MLIGSSRQGYSEQLGHEGSKLVHSSNVANFPSAILVPLVTVDDFCESRNLHTVDVVKLDTEGSELNIIKGALVTLRKRHVKFLTYECVQNCHTEAHMTLLHELSEIGKA